MRLTILAGAGTIAILLGAAIWLYTPDKPRAQLEAAYAKAPSEFLDIAGLRLHVRDTGPREAPAVILLHGFGSSLLTWEAWAHDLDPDYRVIRFDLPGFGLTGPDPTGDYSDARSMAVLCALMDRLGIAKATIVGNSMGGRIAWTFAAEHPDRVRALVLMAPDGFASEGIQYGVAQPVPWLLKILPYVLPTPLLRMSLAPAYGDPAVMTDPLVQRYRDMMLAPGVRAAIVARSGQQILVPPEPLLRRITARTLLLWGEKDGMVPFTNAADYAMLIPNVREASFPGFGHLLMEEAPEQTIVPLRAFLAQTARAG